jgi:hypothetical protein
MPAPAPASGVTRQITIRPRSSGQQLQIGSFPLPTGENVAVITSGVILTVTSPNDTVSVLDIEADQMALWTRGDTAKVLTDLRAGQGQNHDTLEFYLAGNVEIRSQSKNEVRLLRADEAYYDVKRHVAVALKATLEMTDPRVPKPIYVSGEEMLQLNEFLFQVKKANVYASELPYDPGLKIATSDTTVETRVLQRRSLLGLPFIDPRTGQPLTETEHYFKSSNVVLDLEGVPIFYTPYLAGNVEHPLGPLEAVGANYNHIFGFQLYTTWDMYELLGLKRLPDTRWRLYLDYLTLRGPALGTDFEWASKSFLGIPGRYTGEVKAYGIDDHGADVLGGGRGQIVLVSNPPPDFEPISHPEGRGRFLWQYSGYDLPNGFMFQSKISALSDQNFLEQYFLNEFQDGPNQETFLYIKQQRDFWAWNFLVEPNIRTWVTETEWLPKVEGYGLGISLLDLFTYNIKASAGWANFRTTDALPPAYQVTEQPIQTGRFDVWQDASLPFQLGFLKVVPYGVLDLTYYTDELDGEQRGRVYGGGGVRASFPLSRLYPDVCSELFNVKGIYHKIVFSANYYNAFSDTPFKALPQLDLLYDDVSDQAMREIRPWQPIFNPAHATALNTSPLYDPQVFALRQLVLDKVDTRDDIEVLELDVRQRWQTHRGFPGNEHVVDWMVLDLGGSLYPRRDRDDFGQYIGFLQYDWLWNIGDRVSLVSSGWTEPVATRADVFNIGAYWSRPDKTTFYLGYRQIDPLLSKAVIASVTFPFSAKYALTASTMYDFGVHQESLSLLFTRIGTDLTVSVGVNYNSILSTFGFAFEVVPNLLAGRISGPFGTGGTSGQAGPSMLGR